MATISRNPANTFNFLRWRRATNCTISDLPVSDLDPIDLNVAQPTIEAWYHGTNVGSSITEADVLAGTIVANSATGTITIPWSGAGVFLWTWIPGSVPVKTSWADAAQPLNAGSIGATTDLFPAPTSLTVNSVSGNLYITKAQTLGRTLNLS